MNKVGLCTIAFKERTLKDVLELASDTGFDGVEIWGKEPHVPKSEKEANRVKEIAAAEGLEVGVFGSYLRAGELPDRNEIVSVFDTAVILGAPVVRIWTSNISSLKASPGDWKRCLKDMERLCNFAGDYGVTLAIEMHDGCLVDTADGAIRIVEEVGAPCLRLNYQPLAHMEVDEYARLETVAEYVVNVHAQNFSRTSEKHERTLISNGRVDYRKVFGQLQEAGFEGYMEVEFVKDDVEGEEKEAALEEDRRYLKTL